MDRRTLTMNWEAIAHDEDDDDRFCESYERISSAISQDLLASSSDDDEGFDDSRISFASALSSSSFRTLPSYHEPTDKSSADYELWISEPGSITDRRKRLLQGMGLLSSNKNLDKNISKKLSARLVSTKIDNDCNNDNICIDSSPSDEFKQENYSPSAPIVFVRSRSDTDIESFSVSTRKRKESLIGSISKQRITRTYSVLVTPSIGPCEYANSVRVLSKTVRNRSSMPHSGALQSIVSNGRLGSFFLIKNLDTGKEFIVKEFNEEGMWNKLSDLQTGKQLTMEEFEKSVGYSPVVKELMRRENVRLNAAEERKVGANSYLSKSFRYSKRRGVAFLKNIKGVANSMSGLIVDKERENSLQTDTRGSKNSSSQWVKVRQHGKHYKEFTGMHLCQEIQAHEGSIWTIKFSLDAHYLASSGEDHVIHVWEVQECEVMSTRPSDDLNSANATPVHPMASGVLDLPSLAEITPLPSERRKKGKTSNRKKGNSIPDYVNVPESVFALSEKPVCTFKGHQDDVLDLSWSRSQLLLSSSMDKTVRLWDMETKSCLKLFAHNDYVTCIQFNPVDDDYFISGSLDGKVRIWNISDRQVVNWTDLHEMVTAACYTPDGQGALIGSHKGSCRLYNIVDCKLEQKDHIEIRTKKKSQAKKITGFQFAPWSSSEVLITSADSRIRICDGSHIVHKFRGFRNSSSQILASFSPDGKYVISASEDSQVYIWKREDHRNVGPGKGKSMITTQSHEHFRCRDVSVAIPWPGSIKNEPPVVEVHSKRYSKRSMPQQQHSSSCSPTREDNLVSTQNKRQLPPLPKKNNILEATSGCPLSDEDLAQPSHTDSGIGISESFTSASASSRYGESLSSSASVNPQSQSWSSSWSWFDVANGNGNNLTVQATAWGMVIVTAGLGGEIRVYQNFGLPLKVGR